MNAAIALQSLQPGIGRGEVKRQGRIGRRQREPRLRPQPDEILVLVVDIRIPPVDVDTVTALPDQDGLERQPVVPAQEIVEHPRANRRKREVDRQQAAAVGIVDQVVGTRRQILRIGGIRMREVEGGQHPDLAGARRGDLRIARVIGGHPVLLEAHIRHRLIGAARLAHGPLVQRIPGKHHNIIGTRLRHIVIGQRHPGPIDRGESRLVAMIDGKLVRIAANAYMVHPARLLSLLSLRRGWRGGCGRWRRCRSRCHAHAQGGI